MERWCKVACDLDSHPKIRKARNLGRQVFEFALRKNGEPRNPIKGVIPGPMMDLWYVSDQLMMTEAEASAGIELAIAARLLERDGNAYRIVGWNLGEWGDEKDVADARRRGGLARAANAVRSESGAFIPKLTSSAGSAGPAQLDSLPAQLATAGPAQASCPAKKRGEEKRVRGEKKREEKNTEAAPSGLVDLKSTVDRVFKPKAKPGDPTPEELASVTSVLAKLTVRTGITYRGSKEHIRLIVARLRDGESEMDLRAVIGYCAVELKWEEKPEMRPYLRPETLFGPKTIARYLDAARAWFQKLDDGPVVETPVSRGRYEPADLTGIEPHWWGNPKPQQETTDA